jgi:preprotein translocase subunit SecA
LLGLTRVSDSEFNKKLEDTFKLKQQERIKLIGENENNNIEKRIFLQIIDFTWRSHLQYLEQLRQVIGLRSYGQKDPLSEFKKEAFALFEGLLEKIKIDVIKFLLNLNIVVKNQEKEETEKQNPPHNKKIGRNDKCLCGSGKKYKHCCGSI